MKKRFLALAATLCLLLALAVPALAASDYDLAYDATDQMDTAFMNELGYDIFPSLTDQYKVQVRLDIVTDLEGYSIEDYAKLFYDQYDYGYGDTTDGVLLMLYLIEGADDLSFGGAWVEAQGRAADMLGETGVQQLRTQVESSLGVGMDGPLAQDTALVQQTLTDYTTALEAQLAAAPPVAGTEAPPPAAGTEEPAPSASTNGEADAQLDHVTDAAALLSDAQWAELEARAANLSQQYHCSVYIVTVDDYTNYSGSDVRGCAEEIFTDYDLGWGADRDGVLLLLSMADRDYALIAHGDFGNAAFTDYGKDVLSDEFLDDFRYDEWYDGFSDYLDESGDMMAAARDGHPVDVPGYSGGGSSSHSSQRITAGGVAGCIIVGLIVALIVCTVFKKKMKSAKIQTLAEEYVEPEGVQITVKEDHFSHRTVHREVIEKRSGGSGGTTINLGGFSGKSGKF